MPQQRHCKAAGGGGKEEEGGCDRDAVSGSRGPLLGGEDKGGRKGGDMAVRCDDAEKPAAAELLPVFAVTRFISQEDVSMFKSFIQYSLHEVSSGGSP